MNANGSIIFAALKRGTLILFLLLVLQALHAEAGNKCPAVKHAADQVELNTTNSIPQGELENGCTIGHVQQLPGKRLSPAVFTAAGDAPAPGSFVPTPYSNSIPCAVFAKSYLSHIYPSHNFW